MHTDFPATTYPRAGHTYNAKYDEYFFIKTMKIQGFIDTGTTSVYPSSRALLISMMKLEIIRNFSLEKILHPTTFVHEVEGKLP